MTRRKMALAVGMLVLAVEMTRMAVDCYCWTLPRVVPARKEEALGDGLRRVLRTWSDWILPACDVHRIRVVVDDVHRVPAAIAVDVLLNDEARVPIHHHFWDHRRAHVHPFRPFWHWVEGRVVRRDDHHHNAIDLVPETKGILLSLVVAVHHTFLDHHTVHEAGVDDFHIDHKEAFLVHHIHPRILRTFDWDVVEVVVKKEDTATNRLRCYCRHSLPVLWGVSGPGLVRHRVA